MTNANVSPASFLFLRPCSVCGKSICSVSRMSLSGEVNSGSTVGISAFAGDVTERCEAGTSLRIAATKSQLLMVMEEMSSTSFSEER